MRITGIYETIGWLTYFVPHPLPPYSPSLVMDEELTRFYDAAIKQLGQLDGMMQRLPNQKRFIKAYVMKEALLSSAIEGIHTTLLDVFTQPLTGTISKETQLVLNYTKALETACSMVKEDKLPIASRVILKAHQQLMFLEGDENKATPGHYRQLAVRVGNLIPTYAAKIPDLMAQLAQFINKDNTLSPLIKAGLAHVQFETIHPFLDGNGRIGRLLIVLMFIQSDLLSTPIIYPSYYFKKYRYEYYMHLDRVRTHGDFEGWIKYYLTAIEQSCSDAYSRIKDIEFLEQEIKNTIAMHESFAGIQETANQALVILFEFPVITTTDLSERINKSYNTTNNIITQFVNARILVPSNAEQQRNKRYVFERYLKVLENEY
jgi:Fic family protein